MLLKGSKLKFEIVFKSLYSELIKSLLQTARMLILFDMHFVLKKYLYFSNYKLKCSIGKRELRRIKMKEIKATPKGTYALKPAL